MVIFNVLNFYRPTHERYATRKRFGLLLILVWSHIASCEQVVIYPAPESATDTRASYPLAVLKLCAQNPKHGFVLQPSALHAQQGRNIRQLFLNKDIDIIWSANNATRENLLLRIRTPIDRGLIGWRLLLIKNKDTDLFNAISTREQLSILKAGQGHDWPDLDILQANHFNVDTSSTYEGLFQMLARGHIQYFPRSVSEIWAELEAHQALDIQIQKTLVIHYPQALYFFVNKNNTALAEQLTACLTTANADGSLHKLFYQYYRDAINKSDLRHRTIINLENPLPASDASSPGSYWFSPMEAQ